MDSHFLLEEMLSADAGLVKRLLCYVFQQGLKNQLYLNCPELPDRPGAHCLLDHGRPENRSQTGAGGSYAPLPADFRQYAPYQPFFPEPGAKTDGTGRLFPAG